MQTLGTLVSPTAKQTLRAVRQEYVNLIDLAEGKLSDYLGLLYRYALKITKNLTIERYNTTLSPAVMASHVAMYDLCEKNNIPRCADLIVFREGELSAVFGDNVDIATNSDEIVKHLSYLAKMGFEEHKYTKAWGKIQRENFLILSAKELDRHGDKIKLVKKFYFDFCEKAPIKSDAERYDACLGALPRIFKKLQNEVDFIDLFSPFVAKVGPLLQKIKSEATADKIWSAIEAIVPDDLIIDIYPIIFAGSVKFFQERASFPGDEIKKTTAIFDHPKVKEILGNDENLIKKEFIVATRQNFQSGTWIKELIKNAAEADAKNIHINVKTDTNDQLVVEILDDGPGVPDDKMHFFYIPKLTSKTYNKNDINFGWGFFTVFKDFNEVTIESSTDGTKRSTIRLVNGNDQFFIGEADFKMNANALKGTKISLRQLMKPATKADPVVLKAKLLRFAQGHPTLTIFFNGELFEHKHCDIFHGPTIVPIRHLGPKKEVQVYAHPQFGLFYNGLAQTSSLEAYLNSLPLEILRLVKKLPEKIAVNLVGDFSQNASRTGFLEEEQFKDELNMLVQEALFIQIARAIAKNPSPFVDLFPSDFFYEFGSSFMASYQHGIDGLKQKILSNKNLPLAEILKSRNFGMYIASLPLFDKDSMSLFELRVDVKNKLTHLGVLDKFGAYSPGANRIKIHLAIDGSEALQPLMQWFKRDIARKLSVTEWQGQIEGTGKVLQHNVTIDNLPADQVDKKPQLKKFISLMKTSARTFLQENVEILFYNENDGAEAHSKQGQSGPLRQIAFNLKGFWLNEFLTMLSDPNKEWSPNIYLNLLFFLSHELVHTYEAIGEISHDRAFFEKQEKLLQKLFAISDEDHEMLAKMCRSTNID